MTRWRWLLKRVAGLIWLRAAIISTLGLLLALAAAVAAPHIPYHFSANVGQQAVGSILQIMASSMLAVTTFSLTAMVQAYSSATQLATPRATQLMIADPTSQNALSTFLGAFVFSIVGIVALSTGVYGDEGRIILFAGTVAVIAAVVVTLLRWIGHIIAFGRMADVIDRVERGAIDAMREFVARPFLGGRPAVAVPATATPLYGATTGYVAHIDVAALGRIARRRDLTLHIAVRPGTMVYPSRPLLHVEGDPGDAGDALLAAFAIERHRSYDQDPRLGLIALAEIGSRALSPATNDPGTAIEVANALARVLLHLPAEDRSAGDLADRPRVHVGRPTRDEMLVDAFRPLIRDGASAIEVLVRLSKTMAAVRDGIPDGDASLRPLADELLERGRAGLAYAPDRAALEALHRRLWPDRASATLDKPAPLA